MLGIVHDLHATVFRGNVYCQKAEEEKNEFTDGERDGEMTRQDKANGENVHCSISGGHMGGYMGGYTGVHCEQFLCLAIFTIKRWGNIGFP